MQDMAEDHALLTIREAVPCARDCSARDQPYSTEVHTATLNVGGETTIVPYDLLLLEGLEDLILIRHAMEGQIDFTEADEVDQDLHMAGTEDIEAEVQGLGILKMRVACQFQGEILYKSQMYRSFWWTSQTGRLWVIFSSLFEIVGFGAMCYSCPEEFHCRRL